MAKPATMTTLTPPYSDTVSTVPGQAAPAGTVPEHTQQDPPGKGEQATLTLREASEHTGRPVKTLRRWIRENKLPAALVDGPNGPEYRIPLASLPAEGTLPGGDKDRPGQAAREYTFHNTLNGYAHPAGRQGEHPAHGAGVSGNQAGPGAGAAALPRPDLVEHYERLITEKDARISDLSGQLEERNRAEGELRRLLLAAHSELTELRRAALSAGALRSEDPGPPAAAVELQQTEEPDAEEPDQATTGPEPGPEPEPPAAPVAEVETAGVETAEVQKCGQEEQAEGETAGDGGDVAREPVSTGADPAAVAELAPEGQTAEQEGPASRPRPWWMFWR